VYQQSHDGRQPNITGDDDPKSAFIHKSSRRMGHYSEHINIKGEIAKAQGQVSQDAKVQSERERKRL
jgi:hypothetical protein